MLPPLKGFLLFIFERQFGTPKSTCFYLLHCGMLLNWSNLQSPLEVVGNILAALGV